MLDTLLTYVRQALSAYPTSLDQDMELLGELMGGGKEPDESQAWWGVTAMRVCVCVHVHVCMCVHFMYQCSILADTACCMCNHVFMQSCQRFCILFTWLLVCVPAHRDGVCQQGACAGAACPDQ